MCVSRCWAIVRVLHGLVFLLGGPSDAGVSHVPALFTHHCLRASCLPESNGAQEGRASYGVRIRDGRIGILGSAVRHLLLTRLGHTTGPVCDHLRRGHERLVTGIRGLHVGRSFEDGGCAEGNASTIHVEDARKDRRAVFKAGNDLHLVALGADANPGQVFIGNRLIGQMFGSTLFAKALFVPADAFGEHGGRKGLRPHWAIDGAGQAHAGEAVDFNYAFLLAVRHEEGR
jgi:hypothetical protein